MRKGERVSKITAYTAGMPSRWALNQIAAMAGGWSMVHHTGGWMDPQGRYLTEWGSTITVLVSNSDTAWSNVVEILRHDARERGEDSILITREPVKVEAV